MLTNRTPYTEPSTPPHSAENTPDASPAALQRRASAASTSTSTLPVPSADLLRGHKTVGIAHNGMLYTLQATKMGKLILTK